MFHISFINKIPGSFSSSSSYFVCLLSGPESSSDLSSLEAFLFVFLLLASALSESDSEALEVLLDFFSFAVALLSAFE